MNLVLFFKVITSSVALEENITTTDKANDFYCKGYEEFEDTSSGTLKIKCWSATPHGSQTLRKALGNSCNPAFMQLGKRIELLHCTNIIMLLDYLNLLIQDYMENKVVYSKN